MKELLKIVRYSWALKRFYLATGALVVVISLLNQATPFLTKFMIDGLIKGGQPFEYFVWLVAGILIANVSVTLISNWQGFLGDILGTKLYTLLAQRYFDHVTKLPMEYFDNEVSGRITSRLDRSIATISQLINALANNFIGFFLTSAITLVILAYYSWPVALLLAGLFPLYIWLTTLSSRAWQKKQEHINKDVDYATGRFIEVIGQIRVVKAFVQEKAESLLYGNKRGSVEVKTKEQSRQWHYYDVIRQLGLNIVFFGIYGIIIWQAYRGDISIGTAVLLIQLSTQAQWPLFASSFIVDQVQRASAGSKDYFKVMETEPLIQDAKDAKPLEVKDAKVQYKGVHFSYTGGNKVLTDISFAVEPGSKLALVGESGEGKSTISNLLLRFYEPSKGQILIDGQDIAKVTQASLRAAVGVVFQDPALFSGTVAENICYGSPGASKAQMEQAAKAANADGFIAKLPKGYDTEIGERGVKLSGGQKQRIAIARAILKNPPILILDEATSSLDSKAEQEVQQALERLMQDRTTLIIAHRLSTIQNVDLIVGISGGEVAEMGSPEQLAKGKGIYAELLALQTPTKANKAKLRKYDISKV